MIGSSEKSARTEFTKRQDLNQRTLAETLVTLSRCLDITGDFLEHSQDPIERACFAVLDDDVTALLDECEELLVLGDTESKELDSLEARADCVMEELLSLLRKTASANQKKSLNR